jgi:hypothetical protein
MQRGLGIAMHKSPTVAAGPGPYLGPESRERRLSYGNPNPS